MRRLGATFDRAFRLHGRRLTPPTAPSCHSAAARAHAGPARLAFRHLHTGETIDLVYAEAGGYRAEALARLDRFLCDWRTGEVMTIDRTLLDLVAGLREEAMALKAGGVGYYPDSGFIQIDTGRVRYW